MKDKTVLIIISAAVIILLASVVIGFVMMGKFVNTMMANNPSMPPMPGMGTQAGPGGSGMIPGFPPMMSGMMCNSCVLGATALPPKFLLENPTIKLTKEQTVKIDSIYKSNESVMKPLMAKLDAESAKFRKTLTSPKADNKTIQTSKDSLQNLEQKIESINIESWTKIKSTLKPDQFASFERVLEVFISNPPLFPPGIMPPGGRGMLPGMMPPGMPQEKPGMVPPSGRPGNMMPPGAPGRQPMPPQGPPPGR